MEIEAKFSIPDRATFERLCQLETLAGYRLAGGSVKQVYDRYLDTSDRAILSAGYACRVRREGQARIVTLKGLGGVDAGSGIHRRTEYEVAVDTDDPTTWPESTARDLALKLSDGRPLNELFSLSQERRTCLLYDDTSEGARRVAKLSLDVVASGGSEPQLYYELEIELVDQGSETDLEVLASELKMTWGLLPEPRSKFERGLA